MTVEYRDLMRYNENGCGNSKVWIPQQKYDRFIGKGY